MQELKAHRVLAIDKWTVGRPWSTPASSPDSIWHIFLPPTAIHHPPASVLQCHLIFSPPTPILLTPLYLPILNIFSVHYCLSPLLLFILALSLSVLMQGSNPKCWSFLSAHRCCSGSTSRLSVALDCCLSCLHSPCNLTLSNGHLSIFHRCTNDENRDLEFYPCRPLYQAQRGTFIATYWHWLSPCKMAVTFIN